MRGSMGRTVAGIRERIKKLNLAPEDEALVLLAVSGKDLSIPNPNKSVIKKLKEVASGNVPCVIRYTKKSGWTVYSMKSWTNKLRNLNNQPVISFKEKTIYANETKSA